MEYVYEKRLADRKRIVPSLHPGANDLIRVLGKQAHCASRTLILCEPRIPASSHTTFHKNCSPKRPKSLESLSRYSSLWTPIQPTSYYYDCFSYDKYPDRKSEYQVIDQKYNDIKINKYNFSPPQCSATQLLLSEEENILPNINEKTGFRKEKGDPKYEPVGEYKDTKKRKERDVWGHKVQGEARSEQNGEYEQTSFSYADSNRGKLRRNGKTPDRKKSLVKILGKGEIGFGKPKEDYDIPKAEESNIEQNSQKKEVLLVSYMGKGRKSETAKNTRKKVRKSHEMEPQTQTVGRTPIYRKNDKRKRADKEQEANNSKRPRGTMKATNKNMNETNTLEEDTNEDAENNWRSKTEGSPSVDGNCVPCEDVEELRIFKDLTTMEMNESLVSAENTTAALRKSFMKILHTLDVQRHGAGSPGNCLIPKKAPKHGGEAPAHMIGTRELPCPSVKKLVECVNKDQEKVLKGLIDLSGEASALTKLLEGLSNREEIPLRGMRQGINANTEGTNIVKGHLQKSSGVIATNNVEYHESKHDDEEDCVVCNDIIYLKEYKGMTNEEIHTILRGTEKLTNKLTRAILDIVRPHLPPKVPPESFLETIRNEISLDSQSISHIKEESPADFVDHSCAATEEMAGEASGYSKHLIERLDFLKINSILLKKLLVVLMKKMQETDRVKHEYSYSDKVHASFDRLISKSNSDEAPKESHHLDTEPNCQQSMEMVTKSHSDFQMRDLRRGKASSNPDTTNGGSRYGNGIDEENGGHADTNQSSSSALSQGRGPEKSAGSVHTAERSQKGPGDSSSSDIFDHDSGTEDTSSSIHIHGILTEDSDSSNVMSSDETSSTTETSDSCSRPVSRDGKKITNDSTSSSSGCTASSKSLLRGELNPERTPKSKKSSEGSRMTQMIFDNKKSQLPLRELVEAAALLTDVIIFEVVNGMMSEGKYTPPTGRGSNEGVLRTQPGAEIQSLSNHSKNPPKRTRLEEPPLRPKFSGESKTYSASKRKFPNESESFSKVRRQQPAEQRAMGNEEVASASLRMEDGTVRKSLPKPNAKGVPQAPQSESLETNLKMSSSSGKAKPGGEQSDSREASVIVRGGSQEEVLQKQKFHNFSRKTGDTGEEVDERSTPNLDRAPTVETQARHGLQGSNITSQRSTRRIGNGTKTIKAEDGQNSLEPSPSIGRFQKNSQSNQSKSEAGQPSGNYELVCGDDHVYRDDYDVDDTTLYYARITDNAFPPVKESYHAAGFMLKSAYEYTIPPRGKVVVKTDLRIELPPFSYGRVAPRRCLVENFGIDVGTDVIDRDFQDNITILLFNHSDQAFLIKRGNKVAQLICETIHHSVAKENRDLIK